MTALRALPVLAVAATAAGAAPAAAAPPWAPPQVVATTEVRAPELAFAAGGTGVGVVRVDDATSRLLTLRQGLPEPVTGSRDVGSAQAGPLPYGQSRTVVLRQRRVTPLLRTLGYSFGRTDGTLGTFRALRTTALRPNEAELAVAPDGSAVLGWIEERGNGTTRVWLAVRRAGAPRFTAPAVIRGAGSARSLALSINGRGRWVAAWGLGLNDQRTIEARIGTTAGRAGALLTVGRHLGRASVAAVVAQTGRTTIAWASRDLGEEQNEPTQLRTNVAPAGRTTFAGQVVLDRGAPGALSTEPSPPSLAAAPDGTTLVGYTLSGRFEGGDVAADANVVTPARVSVQDRDARFGPPQELAPDGAVGRVAARSDGTFAVPYVTGIPLEGGPSPLRVALRAPGAAAFGPGELVAEDADRDAAAAFEPGAAGAPVVLYPRARAGGAAIARRAG